MYWASSSLFLQFVLTSVHPIFYRKKGIADTHLFVRLLRFPFSLFFFLQIFYFSRSHRSSVFPTIFLMKFSIMQEVAEVYFPPLSILLSSL